MDESRAFETANQYISFLVEDKKLEIDEAKNKQHEGIDKSFVRKGKIKEQGNDFLFWQSQSYVSRLETIEQIRLEYNIWKYGNEQRLQRVFTIAKRK